MTSQSGKQIIAVHILPNISRSKGNHTMKLGQLIECNMRKILFEKLFTKCGGKTIPRPFSKISKLSITHYDVRNRVTNTKVLLILNFFS